MASKPLKMGANMEQKPVKIFLLSRHASGGESEQIEQKMDGFLEKDGKNWNLFWEEPSAADLGRTGTLLTLCPGGVIMTKTGETEAKMVFREEKTHHFLYKTPYGVIPMALTAQTVSHKASETGGEVVLTYSLAMDSADPDRVELRLTYTYAPR